MSARVDDVAATRIEGILESFKPINPVERGAAYRKEGWKNFDPKAPAFCPLLISEGWKLDFSCWERARSGRRYVVTLE